MMKFEKDFLYESKQEVTNGAPWSLSKCWECVLHQYGLPLLHYCISVIYSIYANCTTLNVVLFLVKIVPTGVYVGNLLRNIYVTSRDRMRLNQRELEDLQLQIHIINTKLRLRDAEFLDRKEELRKGTERFHNLRARVQQAIAADEELRQSLYEPVPWEDPDTNLDSPPEEPEFILQLLKELKYDQEAAGEGTEPIEMSCGRRAPSEPTSLQEESIYSSASEADIKQNCRVKIVKVTNVYKVAYLKHFIKQKKLRRASKHAILKKKVEAVRQFLEDWQKMLDMVINTKISLLNMDPRYVEVASQEAMGDYTKQDFREFSETDSDNRNLNDTYYEPVLSWPQSTPKNITNTIEDVPDTVASREISEPQYSIYQCDCYRLGCNPRRSNTSIAILPEETVSQMAIEEVRSEGSHDYDCRDVVVT